MRRLAIGMYRLALRAFPRVHQIHYTPEMIDAFQRELHRQGEIGWWRVARYTVVAGVDAVAAGWGERRRRGRQAKASVFKPGRPPARDLGASWLDVKLGLYRRGRGGASRRSNSLEKERPMSSADAQPSSEERVVTQSTSSTSGGRWRRALPVPVSTARSSGRASSPFAGRARSSTRSGW